jgi:hypothetical protein
MFEVGDFVRVVNVGDEEYKGMTGWITLIRDDDQPSAVIRVFPRHPGWEKETVSFFLWRYEKVEAPDE